jgi:hypothetical protein
MYLLQTMYRNGSQNSIILIYISYWSYHKPTLQHLKEISRHKFFSERLAIKFGVFPGRSRKCGNSVLAPVKQKYGVV